MVVEREALKALVLAAIREQLADKSTSPAAAMQPALDLVTEADVMRARAAARGVRMLPKAIVTPLAQETALRYGVVLETEAVHVEDAAPAAPAKAQPCTASQAPSVSASSGVLQEVVAIASDHGGFALKQQLVRFLSEQAQCRVLDLGTHSADPVDYPDFAHKLAATVARGEARFGICIDGMGLGSAMVANRHSGVRAATCREILEVVNAREHNDANVLCLGGRVLGELQAKALTSVFLATEFAGGRHAARVAKIESGAC
jgi:ribose 5-phosphate isomerase B